MPNDREHTSGRLEFELPADKLDGLGQDGGAETEGSLDDTGLAADVTRDVDDRRLSFAERAHHPETLNCSGAQ